MKEKLCVPILLNFPNTTKEYLVYTDASDTCIGAVLAQETEGGERPIQYLSHHLSPSQCRWPIIEKEMFSIVFAVQKFRPFLYGNKFTVRTDHKPLKFLFKCEMKNVKLQKWAMQLSEHDITVEYIKGKDNVQADMLSRIPRPNETADINVLNTNQIRTVSQPGADISTSNEDTEKNQNESELPHFSEIRDLDMHTEQKKDSSLVSLEPNDQYVTIDSILYYISEEPRAGLKLVIPKHLIPLMLSECHDSLGHMGIDKTYQRLREKYHWRGLYKDFVKYIAQCVNCKSRNLRKDKVPLLDMDEIWVPFEKIAIEIVAHTLFPTLETSIYSVLSTCIQVGQNCIQSLTSEQRRLPTL